MGDKSPKSKDKKNKQNAKAGQPKASAPVVPVADPKKVDVKGTKK